MALVWVQLRRIKYFPVQGKMKAFHPGDWAQVGKQVAMRWIAEGAAWVPSGDPTGTLVSGAGIFILGDEKAGKAALKAYDGKIGVVAGGTPSAPWQRTLIWDPACPLRLELLPIGWHLLDTWQLAVPLCDYDTLARDVGTEDDRKQTEAAVRDLRVPLYDTRLIFARQCDEVEELLAEWTGQMDRADSDPRLAFLRALYKVKPFVLALPVLWTGNMGPMGD
jgi:hypothetical protein